MNRIDGLGTLGTSRTLPGNNAGEIDGGQSAAESEGSDRAPGRHDSLSVSDRGRIMAVAASAVRSSTGVRAEKVAALRAAIANGDYQFEPRAIAARLLASGTFGD